MLAELEEAKRACRDSSNGEARMPACAEPPILQRQDDAADEAMGDAWRKRPSLLRGALLKSLLLLPSQGPSDGRNRVDGLARAFGKR